MLLKQLQYSGAQLVSLGQDGGGCLLQSLLLGQFSGFGSEVGVLYAATGCGGVFRDALQVRHGAVETVLNRTQLGTLAVYLLDRTFQSLDGLLSTGSTPGKAMLTSQACVLGAAPNAVEAPLKILVLVCNCAWVSNPITTSHSII